MPAMAPTHPSAEWVFTVFQNTTGYKNQGITFLLGMLQAGWCLVSISSIFRLHIANKLHMYRLDMKMALKLLKALVMPAPVVLSA